MNLAQFSPSELHELQQQIAREIKNREKEELAQAREQILAIAQRVGVPVKELLSGVTRGKSQASPKTFRHPSDATVTWSGRGRQPKWVKEFVSSGHAIDELRI